jgi:hypothetical protein
MAAEILDIMIPLRLYYEVHSQWGPKRVAKILPPVLTHRIRQ